jgi:Helicase associated domain
MITHVWNQVVVPLFFLMAIISSRNSSSRSVTMQVSAFGCPCTMYYYSHKPTTMTRSVPLVCLTAAARSRDSHNKKNNQRTDRPDHDGDDDDDNDRNTTRRMVRDNNNNNVDYIDRGSYWVFMYYLLMVFQQREGHVHVPLRHVEQGWPLGEWLGIQRMLVRRHHLDPIRQDRLQQAGVVWNLNQQHWQDMYHCLLDFYQQHGHAHVPQRYQGIVNNNNNTTNNNRTTKLGTWLNTQRAAFRKGTLLPHRRQQLEALGVAWNQQTAQWETMYQLLLKFHAQHGHVQVPLLYNHIVVDAGHDQQHHQQQPLGTWMATQRKALNKGTLSASRRDKLQALLHHKNTTTTSTTTAATVGVGDNDMTV